MPLNIDFQQIFLHLLNFVILFAILYYLTYKPIKNFISKRQTYYEDLQKETHAQLESAEKAGKEYAELKESARAEIQKEKERIYKELEEIYAQKTHQAKEEAARIIAAARDEGEKEKNMIVKSAQDEISQLVATATEKIILHASTSEAYEQFLNAAEGGDNNDREYQ